MDAHEPRGESPRDEASSEGRAEALRKAASWTRYSTLGVQFALTPLFFGWIGHWLDGKFDSSPWGTISGVVFGFVGASLWLYYKVYPYEGGNARPSR